MIYEKNGIYYVNKGTNYLMVKVELKDDNIIVTPTSTFIPVLHGAKRYTYNELKFLFKEREEEKI